MFPQAKKGTPILQNDHLKYPAKRPVAPRRGITNIVSFYNTPKAAEEQQRAVEPIELIIDAHIGNENNKEGAKVPSNLQRKFFPFENFQVFCF